jgi:hypothetical protein
VAARAIWVVLGLLLAAVAAPSTSAPADLLPTAEEVARTFPYLSGGQRSVSDPGPLLLEDLTDCTTPVVIARPRRAERAAYLMADGTSPFDAGLVQPFATVYRFRTERRAVEAIRRVKQYPRRCKGWNGSPFLPEEISTLPSPRIADRSVAWGWRLAYVSLHGFRVIQRNRVFVQRDRRIVEVVLSSDQGSPQPDLASALRLARLTLRTSRR